MKGLEKILKGIAYSGIIGLALGCSSCSRIGSLPWDTFGTKFLNPLKLGIHNLTEKGGQVYTCKAGPIDVTHARIVIDNTKKLQKKFYFDLLNEKEDISFKVHQPSKYFIKIDYPDSWGSFSEDRKKEISKDISIEMGGYFAYVDSAWHEVWTWHGGRSFPLFSEFPSAFSCEDNVSNALGAYVGKIALRNNNLDFNYNVSSALDNELERLVVLPKEVAKKESIKTKCKRNFDIGLDDEKISPWYINSISGCSNEGVKNYPTPNLNLISKYGFYVDWNMQVGSSAGKRALKSIGKNGERINVHEFNNIVYRIKQDAINKYGLGVNKFVE